MYCEKLNTKLITDNKKFWCTVNPSFSDKAKNSQNIILIEKDKIISDKQEIVDAFSTFFSNVVKKLEIPDVTFNLTDTDHILDPTHKAINKYRNHPSIIKIGENIKPDNIFEFNCVPPYIVLAAVKHLDPSKTTSFMSIPILKENMDICLHILTKLINCSMINSKFPIDLKMADVSPVFKKGDACNKENYRPVSLLPTVSKIYENILATQINDYIDNYFSDYLCGFRKGHSSQHCLLVMFENMKKALILKVLLVLY